MSLRHRLSWPLLLAGAAFFLKACAPVSQVHLGRLALHPHALSRQNLSRIEAIERWGLRVLLYRGAKRLRISAPGGLLLANPQDQSELFRFAPGRRFRLTAEGGHLRAGERLLQVKKVALLPAKAGEYVRVGDVRYRGRLFFQALGDDLLLINEVDLEQYLWGVLPSEVVSSWPMEALKAQAVAARSYALFRAGDAGAVSYDVDDSTRSQVYLGTSKETARATAAVNATSGLVLAWKDRPAQAFFHSNCGGHTADAREVWRADPPYLRGVADPFCEAGPHFAWSGRLCHDDLLWRLRAAGHRLHDFSRLEPRERDTSGRWRSVVLLGTDTSLSLKISSFRAALGADLLRSASFKHQRQGDKHIFEGRGWGHGVGLCQEGAEQMARQGYRFRDILAFYFPGTRVKRIVE